ncbi:MAG: nucleotidyltransferase domain-containing protein [Armatimonadota bacterium]|nr:nucleotidyltransferase domain-containing protein [bacterium]MCS7310774.1 nucleotidyltransferase domain-containing protein [Armatimonadota bacterium]MDW8290334.1 nucleotidyltransferase domain-containing protein [Armatimonadota bacterium]
MSPVQEVVRQYHRRVEQELGTAVQVILFGSHARGEASADSDVDVLVIVPRLDAHVMERLIDLAWEASIEAGLVLSVVPLDAQRLPLMQASPFFQAVQREGVPL